MPATPFIPVPNTIHARMVGSYFGDTIINNLYVNKPAGTITQTDLGTLATRLHDWWTANMMPSLADEYFFTGVQLRDLSFVNGPVLQINGGGIGGLDGNGMPGNVTLSVRFVDGVSRKGGKPGNHVSALVEANVIGNTIAVDWAATVREAYDELIPTLIGPEDFTWVNVQRYVAGLPLTTGVIYPVIGANIASSRVHTQRSRVNGR